MICLIFMIAMILRNVSILTKLFRNYLPQRILATDLRIFTDLRIITTTF